jgi:hypothetical protein
MLAGPSSVLLRALDHFRNSRFPLLSLVRGFL